MRFGLIGAGKVGFSLGKYFKIHGLDVVGYYSRSPQSAAEAAAFTETNKYDTMKQLVEVSDVLFLTVPDGAISSVWEELRSFDISSKIICHCSGALTSSIFSDIDECGAFGYSIHPFLAVSSKYDSYEALSSALFTVEGALEKEETVLAFLKQCGNKVQVISPDQKTLYHAAASVASNFMVTLADVSEELLKVCGFSDENLHEALTPLIEGNIASVIKKGPIKALTGPVERADAETVKAHINALPKEEIALYKALAKRTRKLAGKKHPERDFHKLEEILE